MSARDVTGHYRRPKDTGLTTDFTDLGDYTDQNSERQTPTSVKSV